MANLRAYLETVPELECSKELFSCYGIQTIKDLRGIVNSPLNSPFLVIYNDESCLGLDCTPIELRKALSFVHKSKSLNLNLRIGDESPVWVNEELVDSFANKDKFLYHFTKFETAKLIINNMTLRFGELNNMNDINESYRLITFPASVKFYYSSI